MPILFALFIIVPILEMWVLIEVGRVIGAPLTILAVVTTATIGIWLLRQQGLATIFKANRRMQSGELPAREILEGLMLAVGGALLLTPGFVTDAVGFSALIPFTRAWWINRILGKFEFQAVVGRYQGYSSSRYDPDSRQSADGESRKHDTIDGYFERED